jgi:TonB family protein
VTITQRRGGTAVLTLAGQAWTSRVDGPVAVVIRRLYEDMPDTLAGLARSNADGSGATIEIAGFQPADLGDDLTVRSGPAKLALGTAGTRGAYRAAGWIRRCLTELERADPGSGAPFTVPPRLTASPITESDYPAAALQSAVQGRVVLDITVSAQGLVSRCDVWLSSGYTILDEVSCPAVSRRAIFVPALDVEGRATEAAVKLPILWKIPD